MKWTLPDRWAPEGRVLEWTCGCDGVFYELRQASGLQFIRRIRRDEHGVEVIEDSERWRAGVAAAQWNALLMGHLR
ncbi:hypothetical protein [Nonomuraea basaltis]|uniref:hypothetical protein n=1 Tax=Nonomuraea basaltis TaxID=2495887 RepID=UPI00110C68CE|nr:hypothetical protein [Nonomuraea basaltis]TMR99780.1 hypothetical protein EJK15_05800 [Nonomuraea basaltis]